MQVLDVSPQEEAPALPLLLVTAPPLNCNRGCCHHSSLLKSTNSWNTTCNCGVEGFDDPLQNYYTGMWCESACVASTMIFIMGTRDPHKGGLFCKSRVFRVRRHEGGNRRTKRIVKMGDK